MVSENQNYSHGALVKLDSSFFGNAFLFCFYYIWLNIDVNDTKLILFLVLEKYAKVSVLTLDFNQTEERFKIWIDNS